MSTAKTNKNTNKISQSIKQSSHRPKPSSNERPPPSSFVFGSSTPREISYINKTKVSLQDRLLIDTEPRRRRKPLPDKDIIYYMRQARSVGPKEVQNVNKKVSKNFAFGSSTPRSLSHLSKLAKDQRIYDAKLEKIVVNKDIQGIRSATNPNLVGNNKQKVQQHENDDDAASEPDIVQDRKGGEFLMTRSAFDIKNNNNKDEKKKEEENKLITERSPSPEND
ncbi:hypothetical protein Mgra_00000832 [Meloidogyne graminicola]|uniref:Uncharacterized protein n=1 Tax=Meloidogyne graminicola TaxID=189291 RepID=A0A8T0A0G4_9BILA|nr:hypothetical protein Mgra_00000832 [Meloidogyne graminicola]